MKGSMLVELESPCSHRISEMGGVGSLSSWGVYGQSGLCLRDDGARLSRNTVNLRA